MKPARKRRWRKQPPRRPEKKLWRLLWGASILDSSLASNWRQLVQRFRNHDLHGSHARAEDVLWGLRCACQAMPLPLFLVRGYVPLLSVLGMSCAAYRCAWLCRIPGRSCCLLTGGRNRLSVFEIFNPSPKPAPAPAPSNHVTYEPVGCYADEVDSRVMGEYVQKWKKMTTDVSYYYVAACSCLLL